MLCDCLAAKVRGDGNVDRMVTYPANHATVQSAKLAAVSCRLAVDCGVCDGNTYTAKSGLISSLAASTAGRPTAEEPLRRYGSVEYEVSGYLVYCARLLEKAGGGGRKLDSWMRRGGWWSGKVSCGGLWPRGFLVMVGAFLSQLSKKFSRGV